MNEPIPSINITQDNINTLLDRLQELSERIAAARQAIAPLEANLKQVQEEFQLVVGAARHQFMRLQADIANLQARLRSLEGEIDEETIIERDGRSFQPDGEEISQTVRDPEEIEKDIFYEHLLQVLDPIDDADLFADLQRLCQDPTASLADVLEQAPDIVWQARGQQESLADQYNRLKSWEMSLTRQLENLNRVEERLKQDRRYGLWQQRQKGEEVWQKFLQQALSQQQDQNDELETELAKLRQQWEQRTGVKP